VPSTSPIEVVLKFEQLINSRNPDAVCGLLTEDSVFIDSLGNRVAGLESQRKAWAGYFKMVPDYSISHAEIFANGETVAVFGSAQGSFSKDGQTKKEDFWKTPAAWRAVIRDDKIALWQVFADNEPIRAIMRKY
jgi:ketosteroid isomerase-like protein